MANGRLTRLTVTLTSEERALLHAWLRSTTIAAGQARRARAVLLRAEGLTITQIAARIGVARRFVYTWLARFLVYSVAGLYDLPRPGPPRAAAADTLAARVWERQAPSTRWLVVRPDPPEDDTMRLTEAEFARLLQRGPGGTMSETQLLTRIREVARKASWLTYHTFRSTKSERGFFDLMLAKPGHPLLCAELKTETGTLTIPQKAWLETVNQATGVEVYVWRPHDLEYIVAKLLRK